MRWIVLLSFFLTACDAEPLCERGRTRACDCLAGQVGQQVCSAEEGFGECNCLPAPERSPRVSVTPASCDFGVVAINDEATCELTLENTGEGILELTGVNISDGVFVLNETLPPSLGPGESTRLSISASPIDLSVVRGQLVIFSNDNQTPALNIPLNMIGGGNVIAIAEILTVNGNPGDDFVELAPFDDVVLTAENSIPSTATGAIVGYEWTLIQAPPESNVVLKDPSDVTTPFAFANAQRGLDASGVYVVQLRVTDNLGLTSSNTARLTIRASYPSGLYLELTWDSPNNDVDLHLSRGNAELSNTTETCYKSNCNESAVQARADWDNLGPGTPNLRPLGNENLGFETIGIAVPLDGEYLIRAKVSAYRESTLATLKVFVDGNLQNEFFQDFVAVDDIWRIATINKDEAGITVTPIDRL